jgi:LAO/AO transport system ATPase
MDFASLQTRFEQRDRQALSRLLTLAARGEELAAIRRLLAELPPPATGSRVIAVTGSAGVGKSTLVGKLIEALRNQGKSVAVLACDPQSPLTGGALLGDRFRMPNRPDDPGVFIRSLATPGEHGAIAEHVELMVRLLSAFGFQWVILETVGAGQGDTAVRTAADQVVLLLQPEAGDDIQWEKAGVLEVADVVVIHKADLPGADRVEAQVRSLLNLPGCREVPVLRVSSQKGEGIADLISLVEQAPSRPRSQEPVAELRLLVLARLRELVDEHRGELADLAGRWQTGALSRSAAVEEFVRLLANGKA